MIHGFVESGVRMKYRYAATLAQQPGLVHGSFSRLGGVSEGDFAESNFRLRDFDNPDHVRENYRLAGEELGFDPAQMVGAQQVHGTRVKYVRRNDVGLLWRDPPMKFDAMVTRLTDVPLTVFHADCAPIFLFDPVKRAVGLAHCGWRGVMKKTGATTIRAMWERFGSRPRDILAAVGPHICKHCFTVGRDVAQPLFSVYGITAERTSKLLPDGEHFSMDLSVMIEKMLTDAGIWRENITFDTLCTCCSPERYWSHRAVQGGPRGVGMSVIFLQEGSQ